MIILKGYGVTLRQLQHDDIELVRRWRNHPKIQQYMSYREEITPEMQEKWYKRIDNNSNYFFIIEHDGRDVGLINIRDIDTSRTYGESGIFIWDDDVLGQGVALRGGLCMYDFAFDDLNLHFLKAHIFNTNPASIKYHSKYGFVLDKNEEKNPSQPINQLYIMTAESYTSQLLEIKNKINKK